MSVSIVSCPNCKNVILSDTLQCPSCHHLLVPDAEPLAPVIDSVVRASADLMACPDCGEMVRKGLVRCWRCGGFLRQDLAEAFQKMQDGPQRVILSDHSDVAPTPAPARAPEPAELPSLDEGDDDDGFELAEGLSMFSADDYGFHPTEADDLGQLSDASPSQPAPDADDTFKLQIPDNLTGALDAAPDADPTEQKTAASKPVRDIRAEREATPKPAPKPAPEPKPAAEASQPSAKPAEKPQDKPAPVSTGDPLLDIALQEQNESANRRQLRHQSRGKTVRPAMAGYVRVFCPNGHQIQVEEKFRGMTGRCRVCQAPFTVPAVDVAKLKAAEIKAAAEKAKVSKYEHWSVDSHLHSLDPTKLKLKPGSLEKEFIEVDLGFEPAALLVVSHGKQGSGLFKGERNKKKRDELRPQIQEYLRLDKEILDLPAAGYRQYAKDNMAKVQVVQPAVYAHESIFAGVPVFGEGRVAVRMPVTDQDKDVKDILFVSFTLTEFREFATKLDELFGIKELGQLEGVPLTDSVKNMRCHYSDRQVPSLEVTPFHKADPAIKLEISGRKCAGCGLVVGEEARKKEKLGGPAGKSIAKTPCPKCKQKFGDQTLWAIAKPEGAAEPADTSMAETGGIKK